MVSFAAPVVMVTGGSRGPGREVARTLAGRGYTVVVVFLEDDGEVDATVDEILAANGTALSIRADITDELDVERLFAETAASFGGVDVIVHADVRSNRHMIRQAASRLRLGGVMVTVTGPDDIAPAVRALHRWRARPGG